MAELASSFNINSMNQLISQASDAIMCNTECQNQRQAEQLKTVYENSQANLASASSQEQLAQKNYVTFTQGETAYNQLQDSQLQQKAQKICNDFNNNFNKEVIQINSSINTYNGLITNFSNIYDLYFQYKKENSELFKEFKTGTNDILTNERKTYYEDQNIDKLNVYYFYLFLSTYVICVICFIIFYFIFTANANWKYMLFLIVVFLALPFVSSWILGTILYLLHRVYEILPKNVYAQKNY